MRSEMFDISEENSFCNLCKKLLTYGLLLGFLCRPVSPGFVWNAAGKEGRVKDRFPKISSPEFENTDTRVVALMGRDVILPCRIKNLNDKVVSWIRTRDLHILTSGPVTFTSDDRFIGNHDLKSFDWSLKIRKTQPSDSGVYECQVNTDPKMNRKITLDVVSDIGDFVDPLPNDLDMYMIEDEGESPYKEPPLTKVLGEEEQFVKAGSTITFTCLVVIPGEPVASVEWLKNGRQVSFQATRGGISVDTERTEKKATSRLTIADVKPEDSGNYTCKPANSKSHSVALVVIEGERMEAMQRHSNGSKSYALHFGLLVISTYQVFMLLVHS